ncbi:MAG TPA: heme peroxidase family protein [Candidatus Acidoferrales bacterium]|jgi:hypothetical protein|nr:heme peroxidase family protein [Candidatus Acidoferrales bacterium]
MSGKHGQPLRGLMSTSKSPVFQGLFGRMFRSLRPATFGADDTEIHKNLAKLGHKMSNSFDAPKDGKDDEESGIPALYTYFGQFIDHDLTFDPSSSLQKQDDPDALTDYRSPAFDLDNVYGRGPDDQPYMYLDDRSFLLGREIEGGDAGARDLARNDANPSRALIGDPRNDENAIVSQLQGLFHRFHNRMVNDHPHIDFPHLQRLVRFHYQYVLLNDFLPRIVNASVLDELKTGKRYDHAKLKFFHWKNGPFMPVEFSVAAYRLGHSMVRPGYRLNDHVLRPIFPVPSHPDLKDGLTGFRAMNPHWGIDWGRFIDIDEREYDGPEAVKKKRLQFAYRIDTSIVFPMSDLPPSVATGPSSLPERNLLRSWRLGLPSGQSVARAMGVPPLADKDILIGQGVDKPDAPLGSVVEVDKVFADNCPLWTYILAEAMHNVATVEIPVKEKISITTPQLGPVGGRIVAEVFLGLQFGDNHSLLSLDPNWHPPGNPNYRLKDFISYALGK